MARVSRLGKRLKQGIEAGDAAAVLGWPVPFTTEVTRSQPRVTVTGSNLSRRSKVLSKNIGTSLRHPLNSAVVNKSRMAVHPNLNFG